jgi:hypothetical protein
MLAISEHQLTLFSEHQLTLLLKHRADNVHGKILAARAFQKPLTVCLSIVTCAREEGRIHVVGKDYADALNAPESPAVAAGCRGEMNCLVGSSLRARP